MKYNLAIINGSTRKVGESLKATAKVGNSKVWFNFGGSIGQVTWDFVQNKWYGMPRLIPAIKKSFEIED